MVRKPSRYKNKRQTPISFSEFEDLVAHVERIRDGFTIDHLTRSSLITILYYTGLRIAEVCGDSERKWKALTDRGVQLSKSPGWVKRVWLDTEEGELWEWRHRGRLPGILKEDIKKEGKTLYLSSEPLKHGSRGAPLELSLDWPYVILIEGQWSRKEIKLGERVWPICASSARTIIRQAEQSLYPHAFRSSLVTTMARDPDISVADMLGQFGWARASTADAYIMEQRSRAHARASIEKMIQQKVDK